MGFTLDHLIPRQLKLAARRPQRGRRRPHRAPAAQVGRSSARVHWGAGSHEQWRDCDGETAEVRLDDLILFDQHVINPYLLEPAVEVWDHGSHMFTLEQ